MHCSGEHENEDNLMHKLHWFDLLLIFVRQVAQQIFSYNKSNQWSLIIRPTHCRLVQCIQVCVHLGYQEQTGCIS